MNGQANQDQIAPAALLEQQGGSAHPCFLWSAEATLLWANEAAAAYWGARDLAAMQLIDWARHPIAPHVRQLVRSLQTDASRLERLPLMPRGRLRPLTAQISRLVLDDGRRALLMIAAETVRVAALSRLPSMSTPPQAADQDAATYATPAALTAEETMPAGLADPPPAMDEQPAAFSELLPAELALLTVTDEPLSIESVILASSQTASPVQKRDEDITLPQERTGLSGLVERYSVPRIEETISFLLEAKDLRGRDNSEPEEGGAQANQASGQGAEAEDVDQAVLQALAATQSDEDIPAHEEGVSPRARDIIARGEDGLRFVWEVDGAGLLTYLSRDFATALGAQALPSPGESFIDFAERLAMKGADELRTAMSGLRAWSGLRLGWPLVDGPERLDVELSAAPAEDAGFRGFGVVRGLVVHEEGAEEARSGGADIDENLDDAGLPAPLAPVPEEVRAAQTADDLPLFASDSSKPIAPDALPIAGDTSTPPSPATQEDSAPPGGDNVLTFPLATGQPPSERRLDSSESAALRTIARVLGGPIGLPRASGNDLMRLIPTSAEPAAEEAGQVPAQEESQRAEPSSPAPVPSPIDRIVDLPASSSSAPQASGAAPDMTRLLHEARLREAEMRAILDTATDGIAILSGQGDILSLNRSAEALFGVESNDVIGTPLTRLLLPASQRVVSDYLDGLTRNGVASVLNDGREIIGLERKGGHIPLFITIGRVSLSGDEDRFCAVLRDITQWKTAEASLIAAKQAAEDASNQKSDFLAKISHEIRTPLNAIIGFSEVMTEERFGAIPNERYRQYLGDIHAAGAHILSLVNDLLDLAKVEAGNIELSFSSVKLGDIIQQAVSTMQTQANRQGVILRSSLPVLPPVVADQRSLRQILFNLISNAIKFTKRGGQVIVSTALTEEGEVTVKVRDSGLGMSHEDLETALKPFGRISTAGWSNEGAGIGLPLTKALAEANRASFSIDSTPGTGTLVQITFPSTRVLAE